MTIEKNIWTDIQDGVTQGLAAAELVNDNKRAVNEVIDVVNGLGTASTANVATLQEALNGTAGVLPDAAGVHAAFNQFGLGASDVPTLPLSTGNVRFLRIAPDDPDNPFSSPTSGNAGLNIYIGGTFGCQIAASASGVDAGKIFFRNRLGATYNAWRELLHTGNMQPDLTNGLNSPRLMRNVSGATVSNETNTAGSGLRFCEFSTTGVLTESPTAGAGTWKNISGSNIAFNEYGFFVRIV